MPAYAAYPFLCKIISFLAPPDCRGSLQAPAWPRCQGAHVPDKALVPLPSHETDEQRTQRPERLSASGSRMERALAAVCSALISAAPDLDASDAKCALTLCFCTAAKQHLGHVTAVGISM